MRKATPARLFGVWEQAKRETPARLFGVWEQAKRETHPRDFLTEEQIGLPGDGRPHPILHLELKK